MSGVVSCISEIYEYAQEIEETEQALYQQQQGLDSRTQPDINEVLNTFSSLHLEVQGPLKEAIITLTHNESKMFGMERLHLFLLTFHLDKDSTRIILNKDYKEEGGLAELTRAQGQLQ